MLERDTGSPEPRGISRLCTPSLCDRYRAFRARNLAGVRLLALFMDAIVRHEAPQPT